jgi:hypothetical protein
VDSGVTCSGGVDGLWGESGGVADGVDGVVIDDAGGNDDDVGEDGDDGDEDKIDDSVVGGFL